MSVAPSPVLVVGSGSSVPDTTETTRARTPRRFYRPELDLLRLAAFALVFVHHLLWNTGPLERLVAPHPWLTVVVYHGVLGFSRGVDLFFTLSAFLITELLLREVERFGRLDIRAFWIRRALRIWPLYFFALAVAALVVDPVLQQPFSIRSLIAFALFAGNWSLVIWNAPLVAFTILWSVSVEEQFYFAWPLLIRRVGVSGLGASCAVLIVVALLARVYLAARGASYSATYYNTFTRLDLFGCGGLLALALRKRTLTLSTTARIALLAGGIGVYALTGMTFAGDGLRSVPGYLAACLASVAIILAVYGVHVPTERAGVRVSLFFGRISYGLYVWHTIGIAVGFLALRNRGLSDRGLIVEAACIAAVVTVMLATASYYAIESPFLRLKDRFARVPSRAT